MKENVYLKSEVLKHVYTVSSAAKTWGTSESAIRKAIAVGKFRDDEVIRRDSTYLILDEGMNRVYGEVQEVFKLVQDSIIDLGKRGIVCQGVAGGYFEKDEKVDAETTYEYVKPTEIDCIDSFIVTNFGYKQLNLYLKFSPQARKLSIGVRVNTRSKKVVENLKEIYSNYNLKSIDPRIQVMDKSLHKSIEAVYFNEIPSKADVLKVITGLFNISYAPLV